MKLPSGHEIGKEQLVVLCERIIGEKFMIECTYEEAFESTGDSLSEGEFTDIPALDDADISYLYDVLKGVVIDCEAALRSTLGTFMANNATVNSW